MWKISRNLIFCRWPKKQQKYVENNKSCVLSKTVASCPSAEKKSNSDEGHKKKQQFKQSERFWNCENMRLFLLKSSLVEKAGWLGTVTVLCFNFHFKHLQFMHDYEKGRSHCLLSRNVLAMPHDVKKQKDILLVDKNTDKSLFSTCDSAKIPEPPDEVNTLNDFRQISLQYAAAVHNTSGLSHLNNNTKKAFRQFQEAARLGSSQAFYNLGLCYELGKGTKVNLTRAAFCYRKAAMKGHGLASFNLAVYFLKGMGGLPVDPTVAKLLFAQAAEKGVTEAQLYVGLEYLEHKNYSEAFQMFDILAKKNILDGKYYLGICYENGWGVGKDEKMATEIFSQAATAGHSKSILKLSKCYEEGRGGCDLDLDFSTALCQLLYNPEDEELRTTLLRLKVKKATMLAKEAFNQNLPSVKIGKGIQNSISVPELTSYQNEKYKGGSDSLVAYSYLDLITPLLPVKNSADDSKRNMFYVGDDKSESRLASTFVPHLQINMPQLMAAKS